MKEKILPESQQTSRFDKVWKMSFLVLFQKHRFIHHAWKEGLYLIPKAGQRHADMSQESDEKNLEAMLSSLQEISETSLESSDFLIGKWDG